MPWKPTDATGHDKGANTPKRRRQWADIANSLYRKGVPEGQAVREANGVLKREGKK